ncbi:MobA/MobL family protein [Methylobacterium sp. J-067]|uniref:MobA/MobL family protein n=1 Tax=Methylobacterium sp. J-067 TaxID=2836648 RepID=UPI001FBA77DA|nr:MobA/MobL family protein [Methylobacterium sp. J-067]MCJ2024437.1 MobA/MobL family protein [Methylobacterium sp. J-067]
MFDQSHTHLFVRGTLASVCGSATDRGTSGHRLDPPRALETALRFHKQPGIRFATREGRERPLSRDGAVTCHFAQTSISKTSPIRAMIRAARTDRRYSGSGACAHESYIERPGAAERLTLPQGRPVSGRDGLQQQAYLERDGAVEADPDDSLALASFGTIGDTFEARTHFWDLVEETERSPQGDRITIDPAQNLDWWAKARGAIDGAPEMGRTRLRAASAGDPAPVELTLPTHDALALWRWAEGVGTGAPIKIAPGRGGRTQTRIIAELPHELDGHARLAIVRAFAGKLAARGFPYWAVVHAPDANNDRRNYHVHIIYYDRPARRMPHPDTGVATWDFAITQEKRRANRTKVLERPYRQPKDRASHDRAWIKDLRTHWGTCCNAVLTEAGIGKRYDLRSYAAIGIDQAPGVHVPARQYNKERKGSLTEAGSDLARRQWQAEADRILDDRARMTGEKLGLLLVQGRHAELTAFSHGGTADRHGDGVAVGPVRTLIRRGLALVEEIGRLELARDLAALVLTRTLSRPRLLLAADAAHVHGRHATVDTAHPKPADPAVPEGERSGDAHRSDLVRFCDDLEQGAVQLAAAYEARIAERRGRLNLIRADLAGPETSTGPVRSSASSIGRIDPALTGDSDPATAADPVPATLFAARVRASLDPGTAALWARFAAVEPEMTEAVAVTPSPATILRERTPIVVPAARLPPDRSAVERAASHAPTWSDAVEQAAERHAARSTPAGPAAGEPALRSRRQPPFDLTLRFGQARRSNGAPLIPPGHPAPRGVEAAFPDNLREDLPIASQTEARRPASLPASAMGSAPAAALTESTATMASAPMPASAVRSATTASPTAVGLTITAIAKPPIVLAPLQQEVEAASVVPAPVAAAVEQAAPALPATRIIAERTSAPAASAATRLPPIERAATAIEPHLPTSASEGGAEREAETPMAPRKPVALQEPIQTVERDDAGDAPWPFPPRVEAPAPAVRVAPPAPAPTEAPPLSVPISAVHGADVPASRAKSRTDVRRRSPPSRTGRGGREIGD